MTIRPEVTRFWTFELLLVHILNFWDMTSPVHLRVQGVNWENDTQLDAAIIYKDITIWTMSFHLVFISDVGGYLNYKGHFVCKENILKKHYICRLNADVFK